MTLVTGTVQDLGYDGMEGTLWARPARFRSDGQVVYAPERKPYTITGGVVSAELAPGPAVLELQVGSHARGTFEVVIPEDDTTLADLLDTVFPWEPAQISLFVAEREAAEQAAADAEAAAGQATTAAQQTGQDRTHVDQVRTELDEAFDESTAGNVLPPRLTEAALNATYAWKRADMVSPLQFGAVGDGVADDTAALQAAINACPDDGIVNGEGKHYLVGKVTYKSNVRYNNARLTTKPDAGTWGCPVTIDGRTTPKQNLSFFKWLVDGNRIAQTTVASTANGALSAWMILGHVRNLEIDSCEGNNSATDGLMLYTNLGAAPSAQPGWGSIFDKIRVRNSTFTGNRRHGGSGDCCADMLFDQCVFNGNGLDVPGHTTDGAYGDRASGELYGNGWDQEQYTNVGGALADAVTWRNCEMLGNARSGLLIYLALMDATAATYVKKGPYRVEGGRYDNGVGPETRAIIVTPSASLQQSTPRHVSSVEIIDAKLTGGVNVYSTDAVTISGDQPITDGANLGNIVNVGHSSVGLIGRTKTFYSLLAMPRYIDPAPDSRFVPAATFVSAAGGPTFGALNSRPVALLNQGGDAVSTVVELPDTWKAYTIHVLVAAAETTGSTRLLGAEGDAETALAGGMGNDVAVIVSASATVGGVSEVEFFPNRLVSTRLRAIKVLRSSSENTLTGSLALLGVRITKKS